MGRRHARATFPHHFWTDCTAAETLQDLHERGIYPIFRPAFSPDLNPIKARVESNEGLYYEEIPRLSFVV
jgi:hypothetical protein